MKTKPRLLFITGADDLTLNYFKVSSVAPIRPWLEHHFELSEIKGTVTDPAAAALEHRPDMVLMLGVERGLLGDVTHSRPGSNPFGEIPLAAYSLMDADSPAKMELFSDMQRLGVEVLFTVDSSFKELAPMHRSQIVYCPWFLNRGYCRDYGEVKLFPIGLYGQGFEPDDSMLNYPWRSQIAPVLRKRYPVMSIPTPNPQNAPHDVVGEKYARTVNRTQLVFTCGGPRHVFVKKYLEIPACGSCLVSEEMSILEDLGFRDMENCVLVSPSNAAGRLDALFSDPGKIREITANGTALIEERHTPEKRDTMVRWLEARQAAGGPNRIVQNGYWNSFTAKNDAVETGNRSPYTRELSEIGRQLFNGDDPAVWDSVLRRLIFTFPRAMEPRFFFALCQMREGQPKSAIDCLAHAFRQGMKWGVNRPDPALWGLYVLAHLMLGHKEAALALANGFPDMRHPLLTAARERSGADAQSGDQSAIYPCSFIDFPENWTMDNYRELAKW